MNEALKITDEDFRKFREFFYRKTGIWFDDSKRYFVDKRLIERIKATGCDSFRSYFIKLRFESSKKELQNLINSMTVNETYFFREEYQFRTLVNEVLPEILENKKDSDPIRIWSIPSSTGEEPYSIAIYLLEYWPEIERYDVEIVASDIDTEALRKAKEGVYSERSVSNLPSHILRKYFRKNEKGEYEIIDELKEAISFTRVNLCDQKDTKPYRNFHVIFCRNLLIYFDDLSRKIAAEALYDALTSGGFVFLGHAESMSRISSIFKVRKFTESIVYQKTA